jgi:hypothetical protein
LLDLHSRQDYSVLRPPCGTSSDANNIDMAWKGHCLLYYRPAIDKTRESAAVTMHSAALSDFVNALCNKGRREQRKSSCKQCAARAMRLKVRQTCNLHTAVRLRADSTIDVRLFSQRPHASLLREGSRISAVSKFVKLDVTDFDHSWLPILKTTVSKFHGVFRPIGMWLSVWPALSYCADHSQISQVISFTTWGWRLSSFKKWDCISLSLNVAPKIHIRHSI